MSVPGKRRPLTEISEFGNSFQKDIGIVYLLGMYDITLDH